MLAVEGILALNHTRMGTVSQILRCSLQRRRNGKVSHRRELNRCIFQRRMLKADRAGGDHNISRQHIHGNAAASADPDKGIRADGRQLLHGDGSGRAADSRGTDADLLPQQSSGVDVVLPVHANMHRVVKIGSDGFTAPGVTRQEHIPPHIPLLAVNVVLHTDILHSNHLFG